MDHDGGALRRSSSSSAVASPSCAAFLRHSAPILYASLLLTIFFLTFGARWVNILTWILLPLIFIRGALRGVMLLLIVCRLCAEMGTGILEGGFVMGLRWGSSP